jgi:hypothetical protein
MVDVGATPVESRWGQALNVNLFAFEAGGQTSIFSPIRQTLRSMCLSEMLANTFMSDLHVYMNLLDRITVEPGKCGGRPCIRGYRLRVSDLLSLCLID